MNDIKTPTVLENVLIQDCTVNLVIIKTIPELYVSLEVITISDQ